MMLSRCNMLLWSKRQNTKGLKSGMVLLITLALGFSGCAIDGRGGRDTPRGDGYEENENGVSDKYSLSKDREALAELRKNIPEEVRRENDEKAFMSEMMSDLTRTPGDVRNKFSSIINKKRELFNKDMTKEREKFNEDLRRKREDFNKKQSSERSSFSGGKKTSDERASFYSRLDSDRREFNSDQQSKRDDFESDMRERRKNFDDYIRSKTDEFNQLHRDYTKRYDEDKKARADVKKQAEEARKQKEKDLNNEYAPIKKKTPTYLETNEGQ